MRPNFRLSNSAPKDPLLTLHFFKCFLCNLHHFGCGTSKDPALVPSNVCSSGVDADVLRGLKLGPQCRCAARPQAWASVQMCCTASNLNPSVDVLHDLQPGLQCRCAARPLRNCSPLPLNCRHHDTDPGENNGPGTPEPHML